jgi:type II secretory pathway pseudopilin PulG
MKHYNNMARQAGMTLIELTVVLLILIGLAGLLVPYVGSFTQTTHDSTNSNNVTQLNNAMGRYVTDKNHLPPHVDTLINDAVSTALATGSCAVGEANTAAGEVYCGLANQDLFAPVTFAANSIQANSLASSGIHMAVNNNPDVANKTFGTSTNMLMLDDATGGSYPAIFAAVTAAGLADDMMSSGIEKHLAKALGRDPMAYNDTCYDYIGVGIGDNNELIQSTMAAAPVFFPQDAQYGPTQRYGHFVAIVQVDKDNTTAGCSGVTEKAKFVGVVANVPATESATLVGANTLLSQGWENRAAN